MSKKSQRKGKVGELDACKVLRPAFPEVRRRAQEEAQAGSLASQANTLGRDLAGTPGYCVQVQLAKTPTIEKKWEEALAARAHGEVPIALTRRAAKRVKGGGRSSGPWIATLPAADFAKLVLDKARAEKTALDMAEDALRAKNEAGELVREVEKLKHALARRDVELRKDVDPEISAEMVNAAEILRLEREVEKLKTENAALAAELSRQAFGGP